MDRIEWKLYLNSPPSKVYEYLNSDKGRAAFWAETAEELDDEIAFVFPNGYKWRGKILDRDKDALFSLEYIGGSIVSFHLSQSPEGGTELLLEDKNIDEQYFVEVKAGWVSVLMNMKAVIDYGVDLRNHDRNRSWSQGYLNN